MCHNYQEVVLGPQANFIIGNNGSGKSAVLTAITLVLGAKARATNRAGSLSSFIKEGETRAEITLHLTNRGDEAFKREIYGDEIIIQRVLSKESSGYKIKGSRDNKIISTKKETLQAILDHFMIQADNPLNVLNQDAAKKFLNASTSKEKYELFIRGTQLQQLTDEYEEINANLVLSKNLLDRKRQDLEELHVIAKNSAKILKEVKDASQAQGKITQLKRELAWVYVGEAEEAQASASEIVEAEERVLVKYNASIAATNEKLAKNREESSKIEAEKASRNDDLLESRRVDLNRTIKQMSDQIKSLNAEIRETNATVTRLDGQIHAQQKEIDAENAKSLRNTTSSRQQSIDRVKELRIEIETIEGSLKDIQDNLGRINESGREANMRCKAVDADLQSIDKEIRQLHNTIQQTENAQSNRLHAYGQNAQKLRQAIDNERSWSEIPLGPLGMHIQLKENIWAPVLEIALGTSLNSYLVTNRNDEQKLRSLMSRCNCTLPIIRTNRELFDYSRGEPAPEHRTILRVLDIDDEFVKRALINDARIEKSILVHHRTDGEPIMTGPGNSRFNIDTCYTKDCYRVGNAAGTRQVTALRPYKGAPRISADQASFIRERRLEMEELENRKERLKGDLSAAQSERSHSSNELQKLKKEEQRLRERLKNAEFSKSSIEDEIHQNASSNVAALEDMKKDLEEEKRLSLEQAEELFRQKEEIAKDVNPVKTERDAIQLKLDNRRMEDEAINQLLTEKVTEHVALNSDLRHYLASLAKHTQTIANAKEDLQRKSDQLRDIIEQAKKLCGSEERIHTKRLKKKVICELKYFIEIVKSAKKTHANNLDQIKVMYITDSSNFLSAQKQIKEQENSIKMINRSLDLRKERWLRFRGHIASRAKMMFIKFLSRRGYTGRLIFNHADQRLRVEINRFKSIKNEKSKDMQGLSGGEKAFLTVSFLITLWDATNCPIRCLDEFDAFMDEVNRKIAIQMMVESSHKSSKIQCILVTPNTLESIKVGPMTRIIKMADPERIGGEELKF
ncbi:hypothetical protein PPACK8108_LOCUS25362 [Phakopsora pachyrhizi]|uniref:RecF/RecN/SMC N-terminal domain-containing protein n=1 Tax=Phakopsora pachyrhizi TaxID=170000 RepID=A0AAV0BRS0_PHAPC|nr:hypothetical protein PPACK8108_LOCUS25360 [Phakopsora pachyrhizi]CAH7690118.1 hypothetical protein PPACK8108_LOCUS25362 [Phakopsora pachyrhizi]